jgi:dTDP-4-dehydrorhamnose 3,5-epimerase
MLINATEIPGPLRLAPSVHGDERGFFVETYRFEELVEAGIDAHFVQDNHSRSLRGVVRGMHFQPGQIKLVRCARGAIFDVIVDVRVGSPTFGHWEGVELNDETHHQLFVPNGFAHGFCVLTETADVVYKVSAYYDARTEGGFRLDDPAVGIEWPVPIDQQVRSARDIAAPLLADIIDSLPVKY